MTTTAASGSEHPPGGEQIFVEFCDCKPETLRNQDRLIAICRAVAERLLTTVLETKVSRFGEEIVIHMIIAESHIIFRTHPQFKTAKLDVFTCGELSPDIVLPDVRQALSARSYLCEFVTRGKRQEESNESE